MTPFTLCAATGSGNAHNNYYPNHHQITDEAELGQVAKGCNMPLPRSPIPSRQDCGPNPASLSSGKRCGIKLTGLSLPQTLACLAHTAKAPLWPAQNAPPKTLAAPGPHQ